MYELSTRFNSFYENCPIVNATSAEQRATRAMLCDATSCKYLSIRYFFIQLLDLIIYNLFCLSSLDTLKLSLNLLGIETADRL